MYRFSIFLSAPLSALIFALPVLTSPANTVYIRDDSWSHGVPANGVTCATPNEPAHSLQSSDITSAITSGGGNLYIAQTSPYGSQNIFWPKNWNSSSVGTDHDGHTYTIRWAPGCDSTQQLYFLPIGYTGYNIPNYTGSSLPALPSPPEPMAPISSNIVLFTVALPNAMHTTSQVNRFCAILTNSDATTSDLLYASGSENAYPRGYHQCNPN